ncbi:Uncharacterised protein [Streptococcus pneumoniae]|nr:Uncharacterised protein [Streptococcus pneumoniae]
MAMACTPIVSASFTSSIVFAFSISLRAACFSASTLAKSSAFSLSESGAPLISSCLSLAAFSMAFLADSFSVANCLEACD